MPESNFCLYLHLDCETLRRSFEDWRKRTDHRRDAHRCASERILPSFAVPIPRDTSDTRTRGKSRRMEHEFTVDLPVKLEVGLPVILDSAAGRFTLLGIRKEGKGMNQSQTADPHATAVLPFYISILPPHNPPSQPPSPSNSVRESSRHSTTLGTDLIPYPLVPRLLLRGGEFASLRGYPPAAVLGVGGETRVITPFVGMASCWTRQASGHGRGGGGDGLLLLDPLTRETWFLRLRGRVAGW